MTFNAKDATGATVPTKDEVISGEHTQEVIMRIGESAATTRVSGTNPMPVQGSTDITSLVPLVAGSALIGKVDINNMPAATRLTDEIAVALQTDAIMSGLTALTPKFAKIAVSASGATTVVAAVSGKKIRVLAWDFMCAGAVSVKWQSHVTPTDLSGLYPFAANGGKETGFAPVGRFQTVAGEALDINLSAAVAVGGTLVYVEV